MSNVLPYPASAVSGPEPEAPPPAKAPAASVVQTSA